MEHPENSGEYKGLAVNKGIEQPSSVNPYLKRKPKKRQLSVAEFVEGIVKGDITILSQAVTLVESVKPEHQVVAQEVIEKCLPHSVCTCLKKEESWLCWLSTPVANVVKAVS